MNEEQKLNLEAELKRAEKARQVTENPVYQETFLRMKADLLSGFEQSGSGQDEERKEIWRRIQTLNKLQAEFEHIMQTGEMARKTLMQKVFKR